MRITHERVDRVVCDWSVRTGTPMTEEALDDLVDAILALFEPAPEMSPPDNGDMA